MMLSAYVKNPADRRVIRTRRAIVEAVTKLIFQRGVISVSMANVAEAANVGRSTLYEHFKNKEELIAASVAPIFDQLADECLSDGSALQLHAILNHFWERRSFAQAMLVGRTGQMLAKVLTASFDSSLAKLPNTLLSPTKRGLAASFIARGTFGVLLEWLSGRMAGSIDDLVEILRASGPNYSL